MAIRISIITLSILLNFNGIGINKSWNAQQLILTTQMAPAVKEYKDLSFGFTVKNNTTDNLFIDTVLTEKILQNPFSNFEFVIEKKNSGRFNLYDNRTMVDPAPIKEDRVLRKSIVKITSGESYKYIYHLEEMYQFTKGSYRIKVKLYFRDNELKTNEIISEWDYFQVQKMLPIHHKWQD